MFDSKILSGLVKKYQSPFEQLGDIETELNRRFTELEDPIRALVLSVASGEPLLLVGPPGTAKSRLIRAFCGLIGLLNEDDLSKDHPGYFEYLLTPFTEPGELFGFYDISKAPEGTLHLHRMEEGMMHKAKVVYLDEVFNGSSAILNSILAFLNERIFHDRGVRKKVAMQCLFAATNQIPETPELRAIFDRFVLRCTVDNVAAEAKPIGKLIHKGWLETYGHHKRIPRSSRLLDRMEAFRKEVISLTVQKKLVPKDSSGDQQFYDQLAQLVQHARQYDLSEMSNRRLVKATHIMLVHRVYEAVRLKEKDPNISLRPDELELLPRYFLDHVDEEVVQKMERLVSIGSNERSPG